MMYNVHHHTHHIVCFVHTLVSRIVLVGNSHDVDTYTMLILILVLVISVAVVVASRREITLVIERLRSRNRCCDVID